MAKKVLLLYVPLLIISSCHRPTEGDGKAIFKYNESSGITTLDPAYSKDQATNWVISQMYNGPGAARQQLRDKAMYSQEVEGER